MAKLMFPPQGTRRVCPDVELLCGVIGSDWVMLSDNLTDNDSGPISVSRFEVKLNIWQQLQLWWKLVPRTRWRLPAGTITLSLFALCWMIYFQHAAIPPSNPVLLPCSFPPKWERVMDSSITQMVPWEWLVRTDKALSIAYLTHYRPLLHGKISFDLF